MNQSYIRGDRSPPPEWKVEAGSCLGGIRVITNALSTQTQNDSKAACKSISYKLFQQLPDCFHIRLT